MPALANVHHEAYCHECVKGTPGSHAYLRHVATGTNKETAEVGSAKLRKKPAVAARIEELRAMIAVKAEKETFLTVKEKRDFLARIVRTPIGEVDHTSDLCQERTHIEGQDETSVKTRMPDKLAAIKLDNDLAVDGAEAGAAKAIEIHIRRL
jgi:hypothetical protein